MHREEHRLLGGTLSHFKCRGGGPFQRKDLFPHHKLSRLAPWGPKERGMLVGTDQAKMSSHVVMALQWAEDKGDERMLNT